MTVPLGERERRARRGRNRRGEGPPDPPQPGGAALRLSGTEQRDRLALNLMQGQLAERLGNARRLEAMRNRVVFFGLSVSLAVAVVIGIRFDRLSPAAVILAAALIGAAGPVAMLAARAYQHRLRRELVVAEAVRAEIGVLATRLLGFDPAGVAAAAEAAHDSRHPLRGPGIGVVWVVAAALIVGLGLALVLLKLAAPAGTS